MRLHLGVDTEKVRVYIVSAIGYLTILCKPAVVQLEATAARNLNVPHSDLLAETVGKVHSFCQRSMAGPMVVHHQPTCLTGWV